MPLYNSVFACTSPLVPPNFKEELYDVPAKPKYCDAVFKSAPLDHAPISAPAPVHSSVATESAGVPPPNESPAVVEPAPPLENLAVLKSATSVQLEPFQS